MYSKGYYARKKFFSSVTSLIWSVVMFILVILVLCACVYAYNQWWGVMGPEIK